MSCLVLVGIPTRYTSALAMTFQEVPGHEGSFLERNKDCRGLLSDAWQAGERCRPQ